MKKRSRIFPILLAAALMVSSPFTLPERSQAAVSGQQEQISLRSYDASIPADKSYPEGFDATTWDVLKRTNLQRLAAGQDPLSGFATFQNAAKVRAAA